MSMVHDILEDRDGQYYATGITQAQRGGSMSKHNGTPCTIPCAECFDQHTCPFSSRYEHYEPDQGTNAAMIVSGVQQVEAKRMDRLHADRIEYISDPVAFLDMFAPQAQAAQWAYLEPHTPAQGTNAAQGIARQGQGHIRAQEGTQ